MSKEIQIRNSKQMLEWFLYIHINVCVCVKEIGESIYDKIQSNSQNQYEIQLLEKEKELKRFYALEMDSSMEKEKSHFQQKLEGIRARMKADYEKVLQVSSSIRCNLY